MVVFCWSCVKMKINKHTINSIRKFQSPFCAPYSPGCMCASLLVPPVANAGQEDKSSKVQKVLRARALTFSLENELVMQLMLTSGCWVDLIEDTETVIGATRRSCFAVHFAFKNELSYKTEIKEYLTFF